MDSKIDKVSEVESLIESSLTTHREATAPRWLQLTVGLLSLPLSGLLALGSIGFSTSIMDGTVSDWQSFVALAIIAALSVFFGMLAYRLLLGWPLRW